MTVFVLGIGYLLLVTNLLLMIWLKLMRTAVQNQLVTRFTAGARPNPTTIGTAFVWLTEHRGWLVSLVQIANVSIFLLFGIVASLALIARDIPACLISSAVAICILSLMQILRRVY